MMKLLSRKNFGKLLQNAKRFVVCKITQVYNPRPEIRLMLERFATFIHVNTYLRRIRSILDRLLTLHCLISLRVRTDGADRFIQVGPYAGRECWYKTALLNTLITLRPKVCLEIGTYYGGTTAIFEQYFRDYMPDGILITADIKKYIDLSSHKRVRQVLVYPHIQNISRYHDVSKAEMLPHTDIILNDSVDANVKILRKELRAIGKKMFDFAFIDGDHTEKSFLRDLEIIKQVCRAPHYALLDDTKEALHECYRTYREKVRTKYNHYEFEDWPIFVGMSLIWDKCCSQKPIKPKFRIGEIFISHTHTAQIKPKTV